MAEEKVDLMSQYKAICNKLKKKRLLKKPNLVEISQQFEQLGINFEREELPQYAGLCYESAAKCQNSLGCTSEEVNLLLKSSKQFMKSYLKNVENNTVPDDYLLHNSYAKYTECLERLKNNPESSKEINETNAGCIVLEMADNLTEKADLIEQGCLEYKKALKDYIKSPLEKIHVLKKIISIQIVLEEYHESLKLVNQVIEEVKPFYDSGYRDDILLEMEITRLFLLLILQPTPQQISSEAASALEKYAWVDNSTTNEIKDLETTLKNKELSMLSPDLFLQLQSLVMACQYNDTDDLELLEEDLVPYLNEEQKNLFLILMRQYTD